MNNTNDIIFLSATPLSLMSLSFQTTLINHMKFHYIENENLFDIILNTENDETRMYLINNSFPTHTHLSIHSFKHMMDRLAIISLLRIELNNLTVQTSLQKFCETKISKIYNDSYYNDMTTFDKKCYLVYSSKDKDDTGIWELQYENVKIVRDAPIRHHRQIYDKLKFNNIILIPLDFLTNVNYTFEYICRIYNQRKREKDIFNV